MTVCWFATFRSAQRPHASQDELDWLTRCIASTPRLQQAFIHTPASTSDPYLDDGPPPALVLQLYFNDIAELEAAAAPQGHLQALTGPLQANATPTVMPGLGSGIHDFADDNKQTRGWPVFAGHDGGGNHGSIFRAASITQQAMLVRRFPVPDPVFRTPDGELPCTYLVAYEGEAEDLHAWHTHYLADHPPIMGRFPGIRQIEIYTCIDWCSGLPWQRVQYMQRNKVVFDSQAALTDALNSPIRHEMRAAFAGFPPFTGPITHFPMATRSVAPIPE